MPYEYARSEYLRALMNQKNALSNNDSLVNPSVSNDIEGLARLNTKQNYEIPEQPQTEEEQERNGWQRGVDTVKEFASNISEGVYNFVDDIADGLLTIFGGISGGIGALFGADFDEGFNWAKTAINYDWQQYATELTDKLSLLDLFNGDMFNEKPKDYWQFRGREYLNEMHENSFLGNADLYQKITKGAGYVLPSVVLAIATGGASLPVQIGVNAGAAVLGGLGSGTSKALSEGASSGRAIGYGSVQGILQGGITALTFGIGGAVGQSGGAISKASTSVGSAIATKTGSQTAGVLAGKTMQIIAQSGIAAGRASLNTLIDPVISEIYDEQAIEKAYGTDEARKQTFSRMGNAAANAAIISSIISTAREGIDWASRGTDGYYAKFYGQEANNLATKMNKETDKLTKQLESGKIGIAEFNNKLRVVQEKYVPKIERYGSMASDRLMKAYNKNTSSSTELTTKTNPNNARTLESFGKNKDTANVLLNTAKRMQYTNDILNNTKNSYSINADYTETYQRTGYESGEKIYSNGITTVRYNATTGKVTTPNPTNPDTPISLIPYNNGFSIYTQKITDLPSSLALRDDSVPKSIIIDDKSISNNLIHLDIQLFGKGDIDKIKDPNNYIVKANGDIEIKLNKDESLIISNNDETGIMESNFVSNDGTTRDMFNDTEIIDKTSIVDNNPVDMPKEYYKAVAELNNPKVFNYSEIKDTIAKVSNEILEEAKSTKTKTKILYDGKGLLKTSEELFKLLNKKNLTADEMMNGLAKVFKNVTVQIPRGKGLVTSELGDFLNINLTDLPSVRNIINSNMQDLIENKGHIGKVEFLKKVYREMKQVLINEVREQRARGRETIKYRESIKSVPNYIKRVADISFDEPTYHELSLLFKPLINLHRKNTNTLYVGELRSEVENLLNHYTESEINRIVNEKGGFMFYDENLRSAYQDLYDSLQEQTINPKTNKPMDYRLNSIQLHKINSLLEMLKTYSKTTIKNYREYALPISNSSIKDIKERGKLPTKIGRNIKARGYVIKDILGNSQLAWEMTVGERQAEGNKRIFDATYNKPITNYIKEHKLSKILGNKVEFGGRKFLMDEMADLYGALITIPNYEEMNNTDVHYKDEKGITRVLFEKGKVQEVLETLKEMLPNEVKEYAKFMKDMYNGDNGAKPVYNKYFQDKYHIKQANIVDDYYPISRDIDHLSSVEHAVKAMPMYSHAKDRVKNTNSILITSALKRYNNYIDGLSKEIYIKPQLRKIYGVINVRNAKGENVIGTIKRKLGDKAAGFVDENLRRFAGVSTKKDKPTSFFLSQYSKATLGLPNLATPIRQLFSLFTSNFNNSKIMAATMKYAFNSEFRGIVKEFKEKIGNVKFRNRTDSMLDTNVRRNVMKLINDITDKLMVAVSTTDKIAINIGLATSVNLAMKDGLDINSDEFFERVAEYYYSFDLSQINPDYLGTNEINDTSFRFLMLFQKPAMVAVGSMVDRFNLWKEYHNADEAQLNAELERANEHVSEEKEKLDNIQNEMDEISEKIDSEDYTKEEKKQFREEYKEKQKEYKEQEDKYSQAKGEQEHAKNEQANFRRFKAAGGKGALVSIGATMVILGLASTALNEAWKKLRGKKEWDEFDVEDLAKEFAYNSMVSWIPLFNTLTNAATSGYDVTLPTADLVSSFTGSIHSIYESIENGQMSEATAKSLLRSGFDLISGVTGIPFKNIYDLSYGVTKMFDPELALKYKDLFYYTSQSYITRQYNSYIEKGNTRVAKTYLDYMMKQKGFDNTSDNIQNELIKFSVSGINVLPKTSMEYYTNDNGERVLLSDNQVQQFTNIYKRSNQMISKELNDLEYRKQDSEYQAKIIKKIYDSYYSYAKAKVLNTKGDSKLANLLLYTNGVADISKMITPLVVIAGISDTEKQTRKDQVFDYVNKNKSLSKAEKLLLLYLSGYSSSGNNERLLKSYLKQLGMSNKDISEFLGIKK